MVLTVKAILNWRFLLLSAKGIPIGTGSIKGVMGNLSGELRQVCGAQTGGSLEWKEFYNKN